MKQVEGEKDEDELHELLEQVPTLGLRHARSRVLHRKEQINRLLLVDPRLGLNGRDQRRVPVWRFPTDLDREGDFANGRAGGGKADGV